MWKVLSAGMCSLTKLMCLWRHTECSLTLEDCEFHCGTHSLESLGCFHCVWGLYWFSSSSPGKLECSHFTAPRHREDLFRHLPQGGSRYPNLLANLHLSSIDCSCTPVKKLLFSHCVLSDLGSSHKEVNTAHKSSGLHRKGDNVPLSRILHKSVCPEFCGPCSGKYLGSRSTTSCPHPYLDQLL